MPGGYQRKSCALMWVLHTVKSPWLQAFTIPPSISVVGKMSAMNPPPPFSDDTRRVSEKIPRTHMSFTFSKKSSAAGFHHTTHHFCCRQNVWNHPLPCLITGGYQRKSHALVWVLHSVKKPSAAGFYHTTYHFCCKQKCLQGKKSALLAPLPPTDLWRERGGEGGGGTAFGWGLWSLMAVRMGQCDIPGTANWATALLILTLHLHIQILKSKILLLPSLLMAKPFSSRILLVYFTISFLLIQIYIYIYIYFMHIYYYYYYYY